MKYFNFLFLSLLFPFFVIDNVQAQCLLRDSIYTAVNNSDFKLEFAPYQQNPHVTHYQKSDFILATSSITHPTRGEIFSFEATTSMGYEMLWFFMNMRDHFSRPRAYAVYGFDSNFESYKGDGTPHYLFIDGWGGGDISLVDTMWEFSHCK